MEFFQPGTLVITPGDREDVILAALSTSTLSDNDGHSLAGLVLSGDLVPSAPVLELLKNSHLPDHRLAARLATPWPAASTR